MFRQKAKWIFALHHSLEFDCRIVCVVCVDSPLTSNDCIDRQLRLILELINWNIFNSHRRIFTWVCTTLGEFAPNRSYSHLSFNFACKHPASEIQASVWLVGKLPWKKIPMQLANPEDYLLCLLSFQVSVWNHSCGISIWKALPGCPNICCFSEFTFFKNLQWLLQVQS